MARTRRTGRKKRKRSGAEAEAEANKRKKTGVAKQLEFAYEAMAALLQGDEPEVGLVGADVDALWAAKEICALCEHLKDADDAEMMREFVTSMEQKHSVSEWLDRCLRRKHTDAARFLLENATCFGGVELLMDRARESIMTWEGLNRLHYTASLNLLNYVANYRMSWLEEELQAKRWEELVDITEAGEWSALWREVLRQAPRQQLGSFLLAKDVDGRDALEWMAERSMSTRYLAPLLSVLEPEVAKRSLSRTPATIVSIVLKMGPGPPLSEALGWDAAFIADQVQQQLRIDVDPVIQAMSNSNAGRLELFNDMCAAPGSLPWLAAAKRLFANRTGRMLVPALTYMMGRMTPLERDEFVKATGT